MWINAGPVFSVAKAAAYRMSVPHPDEGGSGNDALVAIVFSAAALETFINEAAGLAAQAATDQAGYGVREDARIEQFARVCKEIEDTHGSVALKCLIASSLFRGKPYDKGEPPW